MSRSVHVCTEIASASWKPSDLVNKSRYCKLDDSFGQGVMPSQCWPEISVIQLSSLIIHGLDFVPSGDAAKVVRWFTRRIVSGTLHAELGTCLP